MQGVVPMIAYENGLAAMDWLARAFGFREVTRMLGNEGTLAHGEMETGDGLIMLAMPSPDYQGPKRHRETCEAAKKWSTVPWVIDGVLVYVDDVDKHFERAKRLGQALSVNLKMARPRSATVSKTSKDIVGCSWKRRKNMSAAEQKHAYQITIHR